PFDFFHINSLDPEPNGDLLVSARNTWTIYTIDPTTGQVLNEIGGRQSTYKQAQGAATAYQHDATLLPNGTISVFDNGGTPFAHSQSRALILQVNAQNNTVSAVEQFEHASPLKAGSQGDVQLLSNGNLFVGWGGAPYFSEYTPSGALVFDGHVSSLAQSYRVYRFPWSATPTTPPAIAATAGTGHKLTVYASWNGATTVAAWRVLAGTSATALKPVLSAPDGGFETTIPTSSVGPDVEVQALASSGAVLGTSKLLTSP
ncbi:MAG TPA: arylsulfotransferase family protein, partial [Solirubrobacteraceae bacterium]|nr:arylsulfotransferase family protein [Solirubrobacteraceae bacterium]